MRFRTLGLSFLATLIVLSGIGLVSAQEIVYAVNREAGTLDLHKGSSRYDVVVAANIFDTYLYLTEDGEYLPWLAEEVAMSDDARVFTIRLRPGVTFHDGTPPQRRCDPVQLRPHRQPRYPEPRGDRRPGLLPTHRDRRRPDGPGSTSPILTRPSGSPSPIGGRAVPTRRRRSRPILTASRGHRSVPAPSASSSGSSAITSPSSATRTMTGPTPAPSIAARPTLSGSPSRPSPKISHGSSP